MPTHQNLEDIVRKGESQTVEFKRSLSLQREAMESLCAMVNANVSRGMVIFGIEPNGLPCGVEPGNLDKAQRTLSQTITQKFDPALTVEIYVDAVGGKQVVVLAATRQRSTTFHEYDGRAWIRQGTEKKRLGTEDKERLTRNRNRDFHNGPWSCDKCGAFVGMLSSVVITDQGAKKTYQCHCGGEFWPAS